MKKVDGLVGYFELYTRVHNRISTTSMWEQEPGTQLFINRAMELEH